MMLNDRLGDCTIAAAGHVIEAWTANAGHTSIVPDSEILKTYSAVSGYDPNSGANDDGAFELDVLNEWQKNGIGGHKIGAYVALEPANHDHIRIATFLFGSVYLGLALPISIQGQEVWSVPPWGPVDDGAPGSLGGHAVPVVSYSKMGLTCVTWGSLMNMTWSFFDAYCEESYALLSSDWVSGNRMAPNGLFLEQLKADLAAIKSPNPPTPGPVARP
jgi:hypothetical protein